MDGLHGRGERFRDTLVPPPACNCAGPTCSTKLLHICHPLAFAVCRVATEPASDRQGQPASTCHHPPNLEAGEIGGDNVDLLGRVHDEAALARVEAGRVCPLALRNGVEGGQGWLVVGHSVFFLARWMGMVVVGVRVLRLTL